MDECAPIVARIAPIVAPGSERQVDGRFCNFNRRSRRSVPCNQNMFRERDALGRRRADRRARPWG